MLPLEGRTIALPESRELDRLAELVEHDGGKALRCPLVSIHDAPDQGPSEAWLRALVAGDLDDVIFLTGEGLRRLLATAERIGLRDAVVAALGRVRKVTRGPKPARALHEIGLSSDLAAPVPTSAGVIDALATLDLRGRRVGVQLYGEEPNHPLVGALERAGATVRTVAPYVYASAADAAAVVALIDALDGGKVDAVAFTSASRSIASSRSRSTPARTRGCARRSPAPAWRPSDPSSSKRLQSAACASTSSRKRASSCAGW